MARFLKDTDYSVSVRSEIKTMLTDGSDTKLYTAESQAIGQLRTYIGGRVDVNTLLSQIDEQRDAFIIMILIDLVLYHLYSAFAPKLMPEHRSTRYDDAIKWLTKVGQGEIPTQLPTLNNIDNFDFRVVSLPKTQNRF